MSTPLCNNPHFLLNPQRFTKKITLIRNSFSNGEKAHNWNGLKIHRHTKLLKDLSTWGIGGPCNHFIQVSTHTQLISALRYCKEHSIQFIITGKGSNCLFDDLGYDGCVILNRIEFLERIEPGLYRVGSGFRFNHLGVQCSNEEFTGLEFAGGVPGTVGGAIFMNAGANGQETADVVDSVEFVTKEGELQKVFRKDLNFGYRSSPFRNMKDLAAIVAATFRLQHSPLARTQQLEYLQRRRRSQPLGQKSAGSVFRNPPGVDMAAAELIEKAGLKGTQVGGAMVSPIHSNFFINTGSSSSQDMLNLIGLVKEKVEQKFGVELEKEVLYFPSLCND